MSTNISKLNVGPKENKLSPNHDGSTNVSISLHNTPCSTSGDHTRMLNKVGPNSLKMGCPINSKFISITISKVWIEEIQRRKASQIQGMNKGKVIPKKKGKRRFSPHGASNKVAQTTFYFILSLYFSQICQDLFNALLS